MLVAAATAWLAGGQVAASIATLIGAVAIVRRAPSERRVNDAEVAVHKQEAGAIALRVANEAVGRMDAELTRGAIETTRLEGVVAKLQGDLAAVESRRIADVARLEADVLIARGERDSLRHELDAFLADMRQRPLPDGETIDRRRQHRSAPDEE